MTIRATQLQILVVLDAVLTEGSVTRAAQRLSLSQPAVSQALTRARALFADPLFVRVNGRMVPTARAGELAVKLEGWIDATRGILEPIAFNPATECRDFVVCSNDLSEATLLPPVVSAVRRMAPHVTVSLRSVESAPVVGDDVREGRIHLVITGLDPPTGFIERELYQEHFVLLARHGHPALRKGLKATDFAAMKQALVSPQGIGRLGPVDDALAVLGLSRQVVLSVSRFASLPGLLANSDLIAAVPSRFARLAETKATCGSADLPFHVPKFVMRMAWHPKFSADPAHLWFREIASAEIQSRIF